MTLRTRLAPERAALASAITALRDADNALASADEASEQRAIVPICELAERLAEAATAMSKAAREALQASMEASGVLSFEAGEWQAELRQPAVTAEVTNPAKLPPEYMVMPPPRVDRAALHKALKRGPVPGAALVRPNRRTLAISRRTGS